jgi:D-alanyl-D-alanine endopeptidase (penicillin-binding protein 7)
MITRWTYVRRGTARAMVLAACLCAILYPTVSGAQSATRATGQVAKAKSQPQAATAKKYTAASSSLRRARQAQAREAAALTVPRFKVDDQGEVVPDIRAEAAIVYNPTTHQVIWAENAFNQRSIASITKVMTALCFLDERPDLTEEVVIGRADVFGASVTSLRASETVSLENLLHLMLISSDNAAARTLARVSPYGAKGFIARMNQKASELGLTSTHYEDPSGLLPENVSSAYDMARLITYAADNERVAAIMRTSDYTFRTSRRLLTIHSTNQLLRSTDIDVRGGKTGFINESGYCLATLLRLPTINQSIAVVVLGARSNAGRFWETRHILNWIASRAQTLFGSDGGLAPQPVHQH